MSLLKQFFLKVKKSFSTSEGEADLQTLEQGNRPTFPLFSDAMHRLFAEPYRKYLLWGIPLLVMGVFMIVLISLFHRDEQLARAVIQLENKRTAQLRDQMSDVRAQLEKLSSATNSQELKPVFNQLNSEIEGVEKDLTAVAKSAELEKVSNSIDSHFDELEKVLATTDDAKQYVDAKALPFTVVSVDVIAQQPFVSVEYDHRVMPVGVGESVAGWKLTSADYDITAVEFKNAQGKYVKVTALGVNAKEAVKE